MIRLWSARAGWSEDRPVALPGRLLPVGWQARVGHRALVLEAERHWRCLSSAVAGGGWRPVRCLVNLHLDADLACQAEPADTIDAAATGLGVSVIDVGMMTAASMRGLHVASGECDGARLSVLVTVGLGNARRAGDPADAGVEEARPPAGTINLMLLCAQGLSPAAMVETLTLLTEAKTAILQERNVRSPVSGEIATGTGTDATAVIADPVAARPRRYAGKHTRFGEAAARLTMAAVGAAVDDARALHERTAHAR
ncbi:adenosylcobinamide amidohydrolase [Salinisphaera sp. T31B1]|uniref:adenosylcobinamide amidohydrolase n=1 Tax=Salinisphaera sp. T31B1 TaxID=727963 RepID=UPI00334043A9